MKNIKCCTLCPSLCSVLLRPMTRSTITGILFYFLNCIYFSIITVAERPSSLTVLHMYVQTVRARERNIERDVVACLLSSSSRYCASKLESRKRDGGETKWIGRSNSNNLPGRGRSIWVGEIANRLPIIRSGDPFSENISLARRSVVGRAIALDRLHDRFRCNTIIEDDCSIIKARCRSHIYCFYVKTTYCKWFAQLEN